MASDKAAPRQRASAIALCLSLALCIAAISPGLARADDPPGKAQAAEPKLIGRFSTSDANAAKNDEFSNQFLTISDDGKRVAAMSNHGGLSLWDVTTGKFERQLEKSLPPAAVEMSMLRDVAMSYLPGGDTLAVLKAFVPLDQDPRLQLQMWNVANGKSLYKADVPSLATVQRPTPLAVRPGLVMEWNRPMISASRDGARMAVGVSTNMIPADYLKIQLDANGQPIPPFVRALSPPSPTIISVFDVPKRRILTSITTEWGYAPFALSADGKRLAIWDGSTARIAIHDLDRPKKNASPITTYPNEQCILSNLAFSADAQKLVATYQVFEEKLNADGNKERRSSKEMYVGTWEISSGKSLHEAKLFVLGGSYALSADGRVAAGTAEDKMVRIVDASNGNERAKLEIQDIQGAYGVVLSRDGRFAAASTGAAEVLVWDLDPQK